jgi:hypothetical protein
MSDDQVATAFLASVIKSFTALPKAATARGTLRLAGTSAP